MSTSGGLGLFFVLIFLGLMLGFSLVRRRGLEWSLRPIQAFERLQRAIGLSVENGTRLHISLGRGSLTGRESVVALAGLSLLERIIRTVSISDRMPVITAGDGPLSVLSRDTLQNTYRAIGEEAQYEPASGRLVGPTPYAYAAGSMPVILDEQVSANVLLGNFGIEAGLMTEAAERSGAMTMAGTDDLAGQSVLFASSQEILLGEEVFVGGAYLQAGVLDNASLFAQDTFRWLIIGLISLGALLKLLGLDAMLLSLLAGGS